MKEIYLVGVAVVIAACSTQPVRCRGALRPINKPAVSAKSGSSAAASGAPAATGQPNAPIKGNATTKPGSSAAASSIPAATSSKSEVPPAEPRS
jgi:hypothetical protein